MPNVLEALESAQKEQYQRRQETAEAVLTKSSAPRRRFWRGVEMVARLLGCTPQVRQRQSMIVDSRQVEMQPIDRLARDFPYLFIQASGV